MFNSLKRKPFLILLVFFSIMPLSAIALPDIMFESESARKYNYVLLPFKEYFICAGNVKSIGITSYENDILQNKVIESFPNEYFFNERNQIKLISIISDSVAENRTEFFYNEGSFLKQIIEQQYTYKQLYKEKQIEVLRLQDSDKAVRIIEKELNADEKLSTETIRQEYSQLIDRIDRNGTEIIKVYDINDLGYIEKIEIKTKFDKFPHLPEFYENIYITYDEYNRIIEYRSIKDNETEYYYSFEYDSDSRIIKILDTDFAQDSQYNRIYNFIEYDKIGNWIECREDIYSWGEKVSEYYTKRKIEYW